MTATRPRNDTSFDPGGSFDPDISFEPGVRFPPGRSRDAGESTGNQRKKHSLGGKRSSPARPLKMFPGELADGVIRRRYFIRGATIPGVGADNLVCSPADSSPTEVIGLVIE